MPTCVRIAVIIAALLAPVPALADLAEALIAIERRDFATAVRALSPLAKSGDPEAQYQLGTLYANGDGVPQNYDAAKGLFSAAASQGHGRARQALVFLHDIGAISTAAPAAVVATSTDSVSAPAVTGSTAAAPARPLASGELRLQLGTVLTEAGGASEARRVARRFQSQLEGVAVTSEQYQMASGDIVYRVLTPTLAEDQARELCDLIRAENGACLLINP